MVYRKVASYYLSMATAHKWRIEAVQHITSHEIQKWQAMGPKGQVRIKSNITRKGITRTATVMSAMAKLLRHHDREMKLIIKKSLIITLETKICMQNKTHKFLWQKGYIPREKNVRDRPHSMKLCYDDNNQCVSEDGRHDE